MTRALLILWLAFLQADDPAALSDRALELAAQKRTDEAAELWQKALAISPDYFPALFNLGFLHFSRKDYRQAEPLLLKAVRANPKDFNARYIAGAAFVGLQKREAGLRQWRAALEINPRHVKLMLIMAVEYNAGRYFREAAAVAERALDLERNDPAIYFLAIKAYQDAGDHPSALKVATTLAERFPDLPRANFEYGYELHKAGRSDRALPYLKKAMQGNPDHEEPPLFCGEILVKQGKREEAIPYLRRATELQRDYIPAWVALGRALMGLKRYEDASRELRTAIEIDPRHPQPHLLLSQVHFRLGNEEAATKEKDLSLRLRRENPEAMEAPVGRPFPATP